MTDPNPHVAEVSNATARELVLAKAQAIHGDYDGCFERIDEWWALEQWDREAHPQEFPDTDYEDAAAWVIRARAGLAALDGVYPDSVVPRTEFGTPERRALIEAAVKSIVRNFPNETAAWNAWNNLNTTPEFIRAILSLHTDRQPQDSES